MAEQEKNRIAQAVAYEITRLAAEMDDRLMFDERMRLFDAALILIRATNERIPEHLLVSTDEQLPLEGKDWREIGNSAISSDTKAA